jgi:DNA-binding MurR/RpiR family transcriptional regulator
MQITTPLPQRLLEHYNAMPRAERRLADLLLEDVRAMIDNSATTLAQRAGVSKATAARLFQRLGYPSFKAAQKGLREARAEPVPVRYGPALQRHGGKRPELGQHLQTELQNLVSTIEQQRSDDLATAVRLLAQAEKLWVVGFGDNYSLAHFARSQLIKVRPDIRMIPLGGFSVPEEFASITANDVMLAFAVGRRTRSLRNIVASAAASGTRVLYLTDGPALAAGPAAADGNGSLTLKVRSTGTAMFDSTTAAVSLMAYLCASLGAWLGEAAVERLKRIDTIHEDWGELVHPLEV